MARAAIRGSTRPLECFLRGGGVLQPTIVGMPALFRKMTVLAYLSHDIIRRDAN